MCYFRDNLATFGLWNMQFALHWSKGFFEFNFCARCSFDSFRFWVSRKSGEWRDCLRSKESATASQCSKRFSLFASFGYNGTCLFSFRRVGTADWGGDADRVFRFQIFWWGELVQNNWIRNEGLLLSSMVVGTFPSAPSGGNDDAIASIQRGKGHVNFGLCIPSPFAGGSIVFGI